MRIRITEPVFFFGEMRKAGDVLDVPEGPYRTEVIPGGLKRIAQFVEMPDEIKQVIQSAVASDVVASPPVAAPLPASFAEATQAALKPAPAPVRKANPLAARVRALTGRRIKFQDSIAKLLDDGEGHMTSLETEAPGILQRANASASDEIAAIADLDDAMKEFAATNGEIKN